MTTHDDHDRHDRFLIAALAAGDLEARALTDAHELVAACADCAELLADLRSIAAATAALPPLPRPTDFRLSPDTAARLGARGWRGFLVRLADSRFGFSRPLAVGLTTLGLVGAIAGSIPGAMGGFGAGPAPAGQVSGNALNATQDQGESRTSAGAAGASAAPAAAPVPPTAAPAAAGSPAPTALYPVAVAPSPAARDAASSAPSSPPYGAFAGAPSPQATKSTSQESSRGAPSFSSGSTGSPGPPLLLVSSLALLLVGLGILGAQWVATRLTNRRIE